MKKFFCVLLWMMLALGVMDRAFALAPSSVVVYYEANFISATGSTVLATACNRWAARRSGAYNISGTTPPTGCNYVGVPQGNTGTIQLSTNTINWCTGTDSAPDTTQALASQCQVPTPVCTPGAVKETTIYQGTKDPVTGKLSGAASNAAMPTNIGGCLVRVTAFEGCMSKADNTVYCKYKYIESTAAATSSTPTATVSMPADATKATVSPSFNPATGEGCPAGTVVTGVDPSGITTCAGMGTNPPTPTTTNVTKPDTTTTASDGSTTKVSVTQHTNADGSVTSLTTTKTTASDGTVTTKVDSATGNGSNGTQGVPDPIQTDQDKNDLCKLHPELNVCKNSTVSGACDTVTCTGDAIQCSMLRQLAASECARKQDQTDLKAMQIYTDGSAILAGNDPKAATLPDKAKASVVTMPSSLDASGWLGGGACFPDKQFSVMGRSITLSFTKACEPLIGFRYALMIVALLFSFRMVSGVILKD
jgi:hypothetical protein